ncbi:hypothetical protein H4S04_002868 [Coemansia sp. S16]|nr:hypothetical protein H4S04_002868 [Coemansia sp. S16]KAJ2067034.1 hypothetical protein GGI08_001580 [Coemansia sp. S2]KAJ2075828.1 hypothetical protein GGH13_000335 [Coemansia sp. S155-1]KAJ2335237.1 hypothetical protein GGH92_008084 [Coemansia sp. RSA 2673]
MPNGDQGVGEGRSRPGRPTVEQFVAAAMAVVSASVNAVGVAEAASRAVIDHVRDVKAASPGFTASSKVGGDAMEAESEAANDQTMAKSESVIEDAAATGVVSATDDIATSDRWQNIKAACDTLNSIAEHTSQTASELEARVKSTDGADKAKIAAARAAVRRTAVDVCTASQHAGFAANALYRMEVGLIPNWTMIQRLKEMQDWSERYVAENTPVVTATEVGIDEKPVTTA